jgi:hypothetical protein
MVTAQVIARAKVWRMPGAQRHGMTTDVRLSADWVEPARDWFLTALGLPGGDLR